MKKKEKYQLSVVFDTQEQLEEFAAVLTRGTGLAIYRADSLDPEFLGRAPKNSFVLRRPGGIHGKPESWRVGSGK